jgi:hypothetical protein
VTDETRARFLAAIAAQLPVDRIAEVHLFPAIRQGGMESGVAVVAVEPVREPDPVAELPESVAPEDPPAASSDAAEAHVQPATNADATESDLPPASEPAAAANVPATEDANGPALDASDSGAVDADETERPAADSRVALEADTPPRPAPRRYTVFSARYRHILKGPDRGKWETSVVEEADAPLLTVDAVVRGVHRRSGDVDEIVRMSGDEVRAVLPA